MLNLWPTLSSLKTSGGFAQQRVFKFVNGGCCAQPDAHQGSVKLGLFKGLALLFAFDADDGASAGIQSIVKFSPATIFWSEKICPILIYPGMSLDISALEEFSSKPLVSA